MTKQTNTETKNETVEVTSSTEESKKSKSTIKLTREQKKAARRQAIDQPTRIFLAEDCKEAGYRYRLCNVTPGNIESWKEKGYEVVTHSIVSGSGNLKHTNINGNPTEVEVGGASGSMKAIWMRISEDDGQILDEIRDDRAREQDAMIRQSPIPKENQSDHAGGVTKEQLR